MEDLIKNTEYICEIIAITGIIFGVFAIYIIGLVRILITKIEDIREILMDISSDTDSIRNRVN